MKHTWLLAAGLATGCDGTSKDSVEPDPVIDTGRGCTVGFDVGECPRDFSLPNQDGDTVTLSDHVGQTVGVVGAAEW